MKWQGKNVYLYESAETSFWRAHLLAVDCTESEGRNVLLAGQLALALQKLPAIASRERSLSNLTWSKIRDVASGNVAAPGTASNVHKGRSRWHTIHSAMNRTAQNSYSNPVSRRHLRESRRISLLNIQWPRGNTMSPRQRNAAFILIPLTVFLVTCVLVFTVSDNTALPS